MLQSFGMLTVVTPGTLVRFTANQVDPTARVECHSFMVEAKFNNGGKIYIGTASFNKTSGVGLLAVLAIPTANMIPTFSATISFMPNGLNLADYFIDSDSGGDGALLSAVIG